MQFGNSRPLLTIASLLAIFSQLAIAQGAVTTYHNDNARTGQNLNEVVLTPANVNASSFGKLFSYALPQDSYAYAQPLYLPNVPIPGQGAHNVVYVATEMDIVYAFDADGKTTTPLWQADLSQVVGGTAVPAFPYSNFLGPNIGITGTPVIDRNSGTLYVVAKTQEGMEVVERLHALDIATGSEKFGGPVRIEASVPGSGTGSVDGRVSFDPTKANQRAGLLLVNGIVYIAWGAYRDAAIYHGWVMAYDAQTLQQLGAFNTTPNGGNFVCTTDGCDGKGGGVWTPGAMAADSLGDIYAGSGNGTADSNSDFGDSFFRLQGGTLGVLDFFTPFNVDELNDKDLDIGGGIMLPPDQPTSTPHLLISAGKEGRIYVLNRDNMGRFNPGGPDLVVQTTAAETVGGSGCSGVATDGCNRTTPAFWKNRVYLHSQGDVLKAFQLSATNPPLSTSPVSTGTVVYPLRGASPSISANGDTNGIVWELRVDDASFSGGPAVLYAYDAADVSRKLYDSNQNAPRDNPGPAQNFIVPTVANGKVYVATRSQVTVYGLFNPMVDHAPTVVSVSPNSGSAKTQIFTFKYSDPDGQGDIARAAVIINSVLGWAGSCGASYGPGDNSLLVINDAGNGWLGPMTLGQPGTLENSVCSIDLAQSSASGSGTTFSLNLAITFKSGFTGSKNIYGYARDNSSLNSGWVALGAWSLSSTPVPVSVSPSSGSARSQTFRYQFSDADGFADIARVATLINSVLGWAGSCGASYGVGDNSLLVINDAGTGWLGPMALGQPGTLENSSCSIDLGQSSASGSGTTLTLNLVITFKSGFTGSKNIYGYARDNSSLNSGWVALGTWSLPATTGALLVAPAATTEQPHPVSLNWKQDSWWKILTVTLCQSQTRDDAEYKTNGPYVRLLKAGAQRTGTAQSKRSSPKLITPSLPSPAIAGSPDV